jgi:hypothetical protein
MAEAAPVGRFVWYDLMTTDTAGAEQFYTQLFGWGTQDFEGSQEPYTMWSNNGDMIGGFMALPAELKQVGVPTHWIAAIAVADVDETAARAKQLGGSVQAGPMDIPDVGRYAVLMDPQGAAFAVFTAKEHWPGTDEPAPLGSMSWHELATSDWQKAWDFYRQLFGWEDATAMEMGEAGTYQMFGRKGVPLGGIYTKPAEQGPPAWLQYTAVQDADRAAERVKQLGGTIVVEPMEVPGGDRIAVCTDPQGGYFAVHSRKAG